MGKTGSFMCRPGMQPTFEVFKRMKNPSLREKKYPVPTEFNGNFSVKATVDVYSFAQGKFKKPN